MTVVGGGPAGSMAALSLARRGHQVMLLDRCTPVARGRVGEGLPPEVKPLLERLGLWDAFVGEGHLAAHGTRSSWGSPTAAEKTFLMNPYGHGWHVDRDRFDAWLLSEAVEAGADVRRGAEVVGVSAAAAGVAAPITLSYLAGGRCWTVTASAVVDASGRASVVARRLGARRERADRLVAFVTHWLAAPTDEDSRLLVEAAPDGWWYSAPLPGGRRVVVYLTDADDRSAQAARTTDGYRSLLLDTREIRTVTEGAPGAGSGEVPRPLVRAANTSWLRPVSGPGWMAAGDAAAAFDPLSSQGVITAMDGGCRAAQALHGRREEYEGWVAKTIAAYLVQRQRIYRFEQRWATRPFWARRQRGTASPGRVNVDQRVASGVLRPG